VLKKEYLMLMARFLPVTSTLVCLLAVQGCGHIGKPKVIYLARHGQTEWNRKVRFQGDPDLDSVGYINRVGLWLLFKDRPVTAVYTSERLRTRRTAELVARQHKLKIQTRAALNEIDPGVMEGLCRSQVVRKVTEGQDCAVRVRGSRPEQTLKAVRKLYKAAWWDRLDGKLPLGQSFRDMIEQVRPFVEELERGLKDREVLVVGHGVVNRALLHHLMGWPLKLVSRLRQDNDQVYRLETGRGPPSLSLYTPGVGWRRCSPPTRPVARLNCAPRPERKRVLPTSQPGVPEEPAPASPPAVEQPAAE
jgi:broad specificity phosphatase PhoE